MALSAFKLTIVNASSAKCYGYSLNVVIKGELIRMWT